MNFQTNGEQNTLETPAELTDSREW